MLVPVSYSDTKDLSCQDLGDLFLSIQWESGRFPEKLRKTFESSYRVFTAWDDSKLVGLVNVISDGQMVAYVPYLLVRPEYQRKGIGTHLLRLVLEACGTVRQKVLVAYDSQVPFYARLGFEVSKGATSMHINSF